MLTVNPATSRGINKAGSTVLGVKVLVCATPRIVPVSSWACALRARARLPYSSVGSVSFELAIAPSICSLSAVAISAVFFTETLMLSMARRLGLIKNDSPFCRVLLADIASPL